MDRPRSEPLGDRPSSALGFGAGDSSRLTLPRRCRLCHDRQFQNVYARGVRRSAGPLLVTACRNEVGFTRLGLSIGKKLGGAVTRNRFKRLLREAFRLSQRELPAGLDVVLSLRPHEERGLEEYRRLLVQAVCAAGREAC